MTGLLASMMPRDPAASGGSDATWQLVRDADSASAALRSIAPDRGALDCAEAARRLDGAVHAHAAVLRDLFGAGRHAGTDAVARRLRTQLAGAVVSVLQASLGAALANVAEESRLAVAGAILALAVSIGESREGYPPLAEQQRVELLRSAILGVAQVEGGR